MNFLAERESGYVHEQTIKSWIERLREICIGYRLQDIWNTNETGCFLEPYQIERFINKAKDAKEAKAEATSNICIFCSRSWGKESDSLVVWRSRPPHCLRPLRDETKPANIHYFSNPKSWMIWDVMSKTLVYINRKLKSECQNFVLFLDNAPCHPSDFNVKAIFPPEIQHRGLSLSMQAIQYREWRKEPQWNGKRITDYPTAGQRCNSKISVF